MKVGFVSMTVNGRLNPMTALTRKPQSCGNEAIFIGVPDVGPIARAANLNFVPFCEKDYPVSAPLDGCLIRWIPAFVIKNGARFGQPSRYRHTSRSTMRFAG